MVSLETQADKIDADLAKLSNVYDKLVAKVDSIDTTNFVKKTKYEKDGSDLEDKISKIEKKYLILVVWLKKTDFNTKVTEIEGKIPSVTGLAANLELTAVENKILNVSSLVKKTDYNTKISDIEKKITDHTHDKYITTPEFNTLAADLFNARLAAQRDLIRKPEFDFKLKDISDRVTKNNTKHLLVENELKKN